MTALRRRWRSAVLLAASCLSARAHAQQSPADLYGDLFRAVQTQHVFPDGKTFADAVPRRTPAEIMALYDRQRPRDAAALRAFVLANFTVPGVDDRTPADLRAHIRALWPMLVRQPVAASRAVRDCPSPRPSSCRAAGSARCITGTAISRCWACASTASSRWSRR